MRGASRSRAALARLALVILSLASLGVVLTASAPPPPVQAPAPPVPQTLLFVGDVMLSRGVGQRIAEEGDWKFPFLKIAGSLRAGDLAFANLECPVSDAGRDLHHKYSFRADPRVLEGLNYAGFKVVSVANNHVYDWGRPALVDTVRRLREAGIRPVGAGANDLEAHYPVLVDLKDARLAFLAYVAIPPREAAAQPDVPGVAWLEPERVLADIRFTRPLADLVVVSLHWGVEYATHPEPSQVALAHRMIDSGADLVVGSHPHVVQPLEQYREGWIAYSLGNFIFDQRDPGTHRGSMLTVKFTGKKISSVEAVPIAIDDETMQATIVPPERRQLEARRASKRALTTKPQATPENSSRQ